MMQAAMQLPSSSTVFSGTGMAVEPVGLCASASLRWLSTWAVWAV